MPVHIDARNLAAGIKTHAGCMALAGLRIEILAAIDKEGAVYAGLNLTAAAAAERSPGAGICINPGGPHIYAVTRVRLLCRLVVQASHGGDIGLDPAGPGDEMIGIRHVLRMNAEIYIKRARIDVRGFLGLGANPQ